MKIIFITRENRELAAARIRCYGFAGRLRKMGLDTEVFSLADHLGAKSGKEEGLMSNWQKLQLNHKALARLLKNNQAIFFLQRFNYHSLAPVILNLLRKNELVFDLDDWEAREKIKYYFNRFPNSKALWGMEIVAKRSKLCIGASRFLADFLTRYNRNVLYLPTGVDTDIFIPRPARNAGQSIILSWIGTMHRPDNVENIGFLLECFREVSAKDSGVILEIAGDGVYFQQISDLVENAKDSRVKLVPWINPEDVPDYLVRTDIGIMPLIQDSQFNKAKSPTRLFEYMALGKPVIASRIGEAGQVIQDGRNGFLAQGKSEFVGKLRDLVKEEQLRIEVGLNARKTVCEAYSLNVLIPRLFNALKKL